MITLLSAINWILFSRFQGEYNGFHDSTFLMLIGSGVFSFVAIVYKKKQWLSKLSTFEALLVILLVAGLSIPFALYFEEALFNPVWIFANVYYDSASAQHFVIIWEGNMLAWRSFLEMCALISIVGIFAFRKEMKPRIWYWLPYLAVIVIWFSGFRLVASLPLPDGSGYYEHYSYIANGFEIMEVLSFCLAYCLSFSNGLNLNFPKIEESFVKILHNINNK